MERAYSVVLATAPDKKTSEKLSSQLVKRKLAACVSQVPGVVSEYWWEGKIERSEEILLLIKTRSALLPEVTQCVRENHPYSVPEIVELPIRGGHPAYLEWIGASTLFARPREKSSRR